MVYNWELQLPEGEISDGEVNSEVLVHVTKVTLDLTEGWCVCAS